MLTIRYIAVAQQERMKRVGHRDRSRKVALEGLESRSLLSAMAPVRSTYLELPGGYPAAAEVDSSAAPRSEDRTGSASAARESDEQTRSARAGDGDVPASPSGVRVISGAAGSSRRFNSQEIGSRELLDPLPGVSRSIDTASSTGAGDPQASGLELMAGLGGGDPIDPAGAASLVGWAPATATPAVMSPVNPSGRLVGPDGRIGPGTGVSAAGGVRLDSVGQLVPEEGNSGPTSGHVRLATDVHADVNSPLVVVADPDRGGHAPAWADILDRALRPDWEAVDGELRQFLCRLGDLDRTAVGQGAGPAWLLWFGVTTTLILARRASHGRWLWSRRTSSWPLVVSGRHPVPDGPWPLGPP